MDRLNRYGSLLGLGSYVKDETKIFNKVPPIPEIVLRTDKVMIPCANDLGETRGLLENYNLRHYRRRRVMETLVPDINILFDKLLEPIGGENALPLAGKE